MKKTKVSKTDSTIITSSKEQTIEIVGSSFWEIKAEFVKQDRQLSLDENGDLFEPEYKLRLEGKQTDPIILDGSFSAKEVGKDIKEIQVLFEFIEENAKNLFEELGFHGVLL
ncbi:hypothetical protein [Streptococcus pluranimalium]|uniref:hypothetical protein n=1 Tax=Streptococcus pluranimalium TaxID=82348 RepID=UPI003F690763